MPRRDSYKERLGRLECHFLWCPEVRGKEESIESVIEKVESGIEESPKMSLPSLALLSYLYTVKSSITSLERAQDSIKRAKTLQADPSSEDHVTCDFVLRANELHVMSLLCRHDEDPLSSLEKEWSERESRPRWEAAVWGAKGYSMSRLGLNKYKEGIEAYKKAIQLDRYNPYWYFGHGLLIDRLGFAQRVALYEPCDEVIQLFKDANDLGNYQDPMHMSKYALALCMLARTKTFDQQSQLLKECLKVTEQALQVAGTNQSIYRVCAKVYGHCGFWEEQQSCLLKGIQNCKMKTQLYHALACFYWRNKTAQNLSLAQDYITLCIKGTNSGQGYFWAALDSVKIKIDADQSFDPLNEFAALEKNCATDTAWKAALHKERGKYLMKIGNHDMAVDDFICAVESENDQCFGQVFSIRRDIEQFLEDRIGGFEDMKDLALFYQKCKPETTVYLVKAAKLYENIYNEESETRNQDMISNYGYVLIKLGKYDGAIDVLDQGYSNRTIKVFAAEARYKAAGQSDSILIKEKHFRRCMALHCTNGAAGLLTLLMAKAHNDHKMQFMMTTYNDCATIIQIFDDKSAISLETEPPVFSRLNVKSGIRVVLGMDAECFRSTLRQIRYEMSLDPENKTKIEQVILAARFQLDRSHHQFGKLHFPSGKPHCCFPLAVKTDITDQEKVKNELSRLIQSPKENHGGWTNFVHKFKQLLTSLAEIQVENGPLLKAWFSMVNTHKHHRELTLDDYQIQDFSVISNDPYELAHHVAEFTEKVAAIYQPYM